MNKMTQLLIGSTVAFTIAAFAGYRAALNLKELNDPSYLQIGWLALFLAVAGLLLGLAALYRCYQYREGLKLLIK